VSEIVEEYTSPPNGAKIGLVFNNTMLKNSLFDQDALQVIFKDLTIKTYYIQPRQPADFPQDMVIYDLTPYL